MSGRGRYDLPGSEPSSIGSRPGTRETPASQTQIVNQPPEISAPAGRLYLPAGIWDHGSGPGCVGNPLIFTFFSGLSTIFHRFLRNCFCILKRIKIRMPAVLISGINLSHYKDQFTSEKKLVGYTIPRIIIIDEDFSQEGRKEGRTPPFIVG